MEIEPVSFSSTTSAKDRWLDLWAQKLQAKQKSGGASADAPSSDDGVPTPEHVDVEFAEHDGTGAQVVRLRDHDTGRVLSQLPYEKVLDLVADLMQQNDVGKSRGGSTGGQH